ncbi:MAG: S46 family peptidase [Bacteroidales bacterium]|nr:S46 family peptidase [Bacteroidales bacterium]
MKGIFLSIIITLISTSSLFADGGMWLPMLVEQQIGNMQKNGFNLSAEDIYSVNKACMKDAVMLFGGGCTAEIVSNQGLILTNHHCGRSNIQSHSTLEHDYLTDGYWAKTLNDELICNNLEVKILSYMDDVTERFNNTNNPDSVIRVLKQESLEKNGQYYDTEVESLYAGNKYYIFVYQTFKDIRLVGCPPSAVGNFGGDTDNWMWPRHSGDFSMFRIYADKNNNPANISTENVPYKPKKHFKISIKGVNEGDFTMVFGFPGTTEEYKSAIGVEFTTNVTRPARVFIRGEKMAIMQEAINNSRAVRLKYTSRMANVENAKKKWEGEILGIKRYNAIAKKYQFEEDFLKKINSNTDSNQKYGTLPQKFKDIYKQEGKYMRADAYFVEAIYTLPMFEQVRILQKLIDNADNSDKKQIIEGVNSTLKSLLSNISSCDSVLEHKMFNKMIKIYADSCEEFLPNEFKKFYNNYCKGSADKYTEYFYQNSILVDTVKLKEFCQRYILASKQSSKKRTETFITLNTELQSDPAVVMYNNFLRMYFSKISSHLQNAETELNNLNNQYQKALLELLPEKIPFPDANLTLRFTYGKNEGIEPRDGIIYKPFTTLDGVIEKDNPEIYDYHVPEIIKKLYKNKDYGQYADNDGKLHVCFIASNHTTGGNSGSPVINANGELIGINFDRNWEGTMSDVMYNKNLCRNISVDIRYVLFLIDKVGGAKRIIEELEIVK